MPYLIKDDTALGKYAPALARLGYIYLDDFRGAFQMAGPAMADYLQVTPEALQSDTPRHVAYSSSDAEDERLLREIPFSIGIPDITPPTGRGAYALPPAPASGLPRGKNLIGEMLPLRSQDERSSCVAFAAAACVEHAHRAESLDLSEQFLYWACKQRDGQRESPGTFLRHAADALREVGCCPGADWPYQSKIVAGNESQDPPPDEAFGGVRQFDLQALAPHCVADLKATLAQGQCVAVSLKLFSNYNLVPYFIRTGRFPMPFPNQPSVGGHAVCLVGYQDLPGSAETPGGGHFILRNSWGPAWGQNSEYGAGYGTVAYGYIERYCFEAYTAVAHAAASPQPISP